MAKKKKAASPRAEMPLEAAMEELTGIVDDLESGQQPLSDSLERFERGMQLLKDCDRQLEEAAGRIEIVRRMTEDGAQVEPFDGSATLSREQSDETDSSQGNLF